ncbi:hydantoinase B/oxoprolinase family protein, partial [bacterium]|nr:hydantoinase B/oxoprolinase family protein [bacterium]
RYGGDFEIETETTKAGVRIASPTLAIETVAAGGGSICRFDGVQLQVGPESAGADPGPACYGRGGPLTITDANVALGRVLPEQFPFPLDVDAINSRIDAICEGIQSSTGKVYSRDELAQGFIDIANETMSRAIRNVSIRKGFHPQDHLLISFGGAGGQHACAMARRLGMQKILIHPFAGILSAYGMGLAEIRKREERSLLSPLNSLPPAHLAAIHEEMRFRLLTEMQTEGVNSNQIQASDFSLALRYAGLESTISVQGDSADEFATAYHAEHRRLYGYAHPERPIEVVSASLEVVAENSASITSATSKTFSQQTLDPGDRTPIETHVWYQGESLKTSVLFRENLQSNSLLQGPLIICDSGSTIWIEPNFQCRVLEDGSLLIEHLQQRCDKENKKQVDTSANSPDLILLEIFNNQFASIAEQMGVTLRKTSVSTNVKERLDYSCAIFDAAGGLVVNAPHIPVHLGAMGETVKTLLNECSEINPGDVFITNDPYAGGSHLPDVTVVTPVHHQTSEELLFLTASRAHHAEIGGIRPGSMPPFSKNLAEEGVLIRQYKLVDRGVSQEAGLKELLQAGPFPSRNVEDNLADVSAQVAANQMGAKLLLEMINSNGLQTVISYMHHIQKTACQKMQRALSLIPDGHYQWADHLDDGSPICVEISVHKDHAKIDFTGTGPVLSSNLNANRAIVTAACMYVFRSLIEESIPLNSGVLEPLEIVLPECLLNPPRHEDPAKCAAMVGGNVETSQRVVDVLLGALGKAAASQGTMNNLTFGDETFGYYETICGGAGATATQAGADAVHTHMTNTRLTDVEVIEHRYPVRIQEFLIRYGSGGAGKNPGGNGISRTFEFLRPIQVSLLTQRRGQYPPFGIAGGLPGAIGCNLLKQNDSDQIQDVGGCVQLELEPGDQLTIQTPGGGGYGECHASGA